MSDDRAPQDPDAEHEDLISYRDGDAFVICDNSNPNAWIRSNTTVTVGEEPAKAKTRD